MITEFWLRYIAKSYYFLSIDIILFEVESSIITFSDSDIIIKKDRGKQLLWSRFRS